MSTHSPEKSQTSASSGFCYSVVHNIPQTYHSKDLRAFFSTLIEENCFDCFHFRHRPELKSKQSMSEIDFSAQPVDQSKNGVEKTCCCIVKHENMGLRQRFIETYSGERWTNASGDQHAFLKCLIAPVKFDEFFLNSAQILELRPPKSFFPQGNIGTPSKFFMEKIQNCTLPPSLIKKLALDFSKSRNGKRIYSHVPPTSELTRRQHVTEDEDLEAKIAARQKGDDPDDKPDLDDDTCQEYERHEAFYDDVTDQDRTKERLYEEEMEIVWEKGGPGLVFYTDSFYWDQMKGTDTDERWADDWDVDTSVYYGGRGDRDTQDLMEIKAGPCNESVFKKKTQNKKSTQLWPTDSDSDPGSFANFERHTKGIGQKFLLQHGWTYGSGLGAAKKGGLNPVAVDLAEKSQNPRNRSGFGYTGEKLQRHNLVKRQQKHSITTKYDEKDEKSDGIFRRPELTLNKNR